MQVVGVAPGRAISGHHRRSASAPVPADRAGVRPCPARPDLGGSASHAARGAGRAGRRRARGGRVLSSDRRRPPGHPAASDARGVARRRVAGRARDGVLRALGSTASIAWFAELRRAEMAIRLALGATRFDVERLILRQAFATSAPGIVGGRAARLGGDDCGERPALRRWRPGGRGARDWRRRARAARPGRQLEARTPGGQHGSRLRPSYDLWLTATAREASRRRGARSPSRLRATRQSARASSDGRR